VLLVFYAVFIGAKKLTPKNYFNYNYTVIHPHVLQAQAVFHSDLFLIALIYVSIKLIDFNY